MTQRRMHLAAFLIAGPCGHSHALWRHPESEPAGFLKPGYYQGIARAVERGLFDLLFFADRLAMSTRYGGGIDTGARCGDQDATRLDPLPVLAMMAAVTRHVGLGATRSTTYSDPYGLARAFATLDHLSGGRAAWNVVTSVNRGEAENFGAASHPGHDERYDRADEFMEVAFGLWGSWSPEALLLDRKRGLYADPAGIRELRHEGRHYRVRGPLNIPRSPQGRPVVIQAGASARGLGFAARWAELVFAIQPDAAGMRRFTADLRERAERQGRGERPPKALMAVMPFVGRSREEARELRHRHNELVSPLAGLSTLASHTDLDLAELPLDAPLEEREVGGMQGAFRLARQLSLEGLTLAEIGRRYGQSVLAPQLAGTAADIADELAALFEAGAADGFVISPAHLPRGFDAFVDGVVPELQRRGLFRDRYRGRTLRDHLQGA